MTKKCNDCENFKLQGEAEDHWHKSFCYGTCGLTGEYKTTFTPCIKEYKNHKRWCHDEKIQLDHADFCKRYNHDCENCFCKEFFEEIIDEDEIDNHFVNSESFMEYPNIHQIYCIAASPRQGGFGNAVFNVELDTGEILYDIGLWGNGFSPNQEITEKLRKGKFIR